MNARARASGDWTLDPEAFARLLRMLDPDRERAGQHYEKLRQKLSNLFRWRGCVDPDPLVDDTIDRVARRLSEGESVRVANPYLYFHGVALNVLREHWRDPARTHEALAPDAPEEAVAPDAETARAREADAADQDRRLDCLQACMDALSPESRHLLVTYHRGEGRGRIEGRQMLAETLGIPMNALRIRVFRIRSGVARCTERCLERKSIDAQRTTP